MGNSMFQNVDIKDISAKLSIENKKYVIAVANALLFTQNKDSQHSKDLDKLSRKTEVEIF